jgi:MFS family permease
MPELSLSQMQIGWIQWAFLLAYTPGQILSGGLGQRFGARRTLAFAGLLAVIATVATPLAPAALAGTALFSGLVLAQLTLGFAQAPIFPVGAGVVRTWVPANRWGFANGIQSLGAQLGAAAAPAVLVFLMQQFGWQRALFWTALPSLLLVAVWAWYVRDVARSHPQISPEELTSLELDAAQPDAVPLAPARFGGWPGRDVALLTLSYASMNYVFYLLANWSFLYLVQERHFSVAQSGWLATLPPLGAALGAAAGGALVDTFVARLGTRWGYRVVPLISLPTVSLLLLLAVYTPHALAAVAAMALCFAMVELNEGAYWAAMTRVAGARTMSAAGILNTGGSLGGLIGIPVVAYLSGHGAWPTAFVIGAVCATLSAVAWFAIDPSRGNPPIER